MESWGSILCSVLLEARTLVGDCWVHMAYYTFAIDDSYRTYSLAFYRNVAMKLFSTIQNHECSYPQASVLAPAVMTNSICSQEPHPRRNSSGAHLSIAQEPTCSSARHPVLPHLPLPRSDPSAIKSHRSSSHLPSHCAPKRILHRSPPQHLRPPTCPPPASTSCPDHGALPLPLQ
jgi:hypothetical protein